MPSDSNTILFPLLRCQHPNVDWSPVHIQYESTGMASIWQTGICEGCGAPLQVEYSAGPIAVT